MITLDGDVHHSSRSTDSKERMGPNNEDFNAAMRENLPQVAQLDNSTQEMIFSRAVFKAGEAVSYGLIQGIGTFETVIERAFEHGHNHTNRIKV